MSVYNYSCLALQSVMEVSTVSDLSVYKDIGYKVWVKQCITQCERYIFECIIVWTAALKVMSVNINCIQLL